MCHIVFFVKSESSDVAYRIVRNVLLSTDSFTSNVRVGEVEEYPEELGWYTTGCELETNCQLDRSTAERLVTKLSDKWQWNGAGDSCHSCSRTMGATFAHPSLRFISCNFERLNPQSDKKFVTFE